ncbi:MAG: hypothetical protein EAZ62_09695 [Sphingobacteriia bacterium]|nr:MAG: hypothetical protein EAZ62_09695 [Sphingobacteriia bacterium]
MDTQKATGKYWLLCFFWLAVLITLMVVYREFFWLAVVYREFFWLALPGFVTYFAKAMDLI